MCVEYASTLEINFAQLGAQLGALTKRLLDRSDYLRRRPCRPGRSSQILARSRRQSSRVKLHKL